jgi:hypothetical protein
MTLLKVTSVSQTQVFNKSDLVPILDTWTLLLCYSCHVGMKFEIYLDKQTDGTQNSRAESEMLYQHSKKIATLKLQCTLLARYLLRQGRPTVTDVCAQCSYWPSPPLLQYCSTVHSTSEMIKTCNPQRYVCHRFTFGSNVLSENTLKNFRIPWSTCEFWYEYMPLNKFWYEYMPLNKFRYEYMPLNKFWYE